MGGLTVPGVSPPPNQPFFFADWTVVDSGYFATLRIPMVAGRDFTDNDRGRAAGTPSLAPRPRAGSGAARTPSVDRCW